jgi:hypothetical protein
MEQVYRYMAVRPGHEAKDTKEKAEKVAVG